MKYFKIIFALNILKFGTKFIIKVTLCNFPDESDV